MPVFDHPDFDDHEHVSFFRDEPSGLRAVVAIHTTAPFGLAGGGCRMWPYPTSDAALRDALRLSRAMSYKLALCEMPAGGAKTVVIGDPAKDKTEALLRALGRAVERLGGRYVIAEDVGTTTADMQVIGKETRYVVGKHTDTGPATAYGAFVALRVAAQRGLGRKDLAGLRVAVQGLGNVGRRLAALLAREGVVLSVTDVDARAVQSFLAEHPTAKAMMPDAIYDQEVDVLAPCALGSILDDATIARLRCRVVVGAANNQLAEERHASALADRGITYAPDFVVNAGGVIGASQEGRALGGETAGPVYDEKIAFRDTERVAGILDAVFDLAERECITPHAAAVRMAKDKIRSRKG
jgi:leucine dehydrogenase